MPFSRALTMKPISAVPNPNPSHGNPSASLIPGQETTWCALLGHFEVSRSMHTVSGWFLVQGTPLRRRRSLGCLIPAIEVSCSGLEVWAWFRHQGACGVHGGGRPVQFRRSMVLKCREAGRFAIHPCAFFLVPLKGNSDVLMRGIGIAEYGPIEWVG